MKRNATLSIGLLIAATASFSTTAAADQDCILEGKVKKAEASEGTHSVYIDFHSATRYSNDSQCQFRQDDIEFNGIVGSQITKVAPGAIVKYRYTEQHQAAPTWQLLQVSI